MKWLGAILFFTASAGSLLAQDEFVAPQAPDREIEELPFEDTRRTSIEGIVAEVFKNKKPLQLINPLAPKQYGNGQKTVSWSEKEPGKPKGFIFFGIEW